LVQIATYLPFLLPKTMITRQAWEGDGRLCFVGMIIHETEVEDLTALATRFYLEVRKHEGR